MKLADLRDARVAVWGCGREGRAALAALRRRFPHKAITLFCPDAESAPLATDVHLDIAPPPDVGALSQCDIVIKSPGIRPYQSPIPEAIAAGVRFTSGTALWFADNPQARVIGVTGTKGKSTTAALIAHLARALGIRTALAGNIGLPLLDLDGQAAELWVVELSSFQTGEAGSLEVGVITNLYEEHLDWHGTRERYVADKLKLADAARTLVVDAGQPELMARTAAHPHRVVFADTAGWHVHGDAIRRAARTVLPLAAMALPGEHNARNVCAALAALEAVGFDAIAAASHVPGFKPLPHRLQKLGARGSIEYVNDSISTTPHATIEALRSLCGKAVTVIVGGFERGVDWSPFADHVARHPPHALVAMGANGARIVASLPEPGFAVARVATLAQALRCAQAAAPAGGVILLSPGAPSFDAFRDYAERGREFARLAGFDPGTIASIEGLGIA
ncbi:MAG: UDP-N-acetylmuramoyl-L-alanine--D-glutamate ligase [Proteobacteria bacterium]|nr:UDP-N-acetylmuramoyl-L-alanine--D-glutamate ligase [Pseudomonadota bacterium]